MADTWTITFTDANGRVDTSTYDNETAFISAVHDKLNDLRTSNVSAVLPDGSKLDEKALSDSCRPAGRQSRPPRQKPPQATPSARSWRDRSRGRPDFAWSTTSAASKHYRPASCS